MRSRRPLALALAAAVSAGPVAAQPSQPAQPLTTPPIPSFELPPTEVGFVSVRELRVRGHEIFGSAIAVKGYITWVYDCATMNARAGEPAAQTQKRVDDDPTLCERPRFSLGSKKRAAPQDTISVVGVPRPPNALERRRLPKAELAAWPAVPKYAVGDFIELEGEWEQQSPHGDWDSDGLIIFKSIKPANPAAAAANAVPPAPRTRVAPPRIPAPPVRDPVAPAARELSIKHLNAGARAVSLRKYDEAVRELRTAVAAWPEHVAAWSALADALAKQGAWKDAVFPASRAATLEPTVAQHHMAHGIALYEAALQKAREYRAMVEGRRPDEVWIDERRLDYKVAQLALSLAVHIEPDLWRAQYHLGRIFRARGEAGDAAVAFNAAVRAAPPEVAPYQALSELYRRWTHHYEAVAVARLGLAEVSAPADQARLSYAIARAFDDRHDDAEAAEAYTQALAQDPSLVEARFMRAQIYLRLGDRVRAKEDMAAYLASAGATARNKAEGQRFLSYLARTAPP